MTSRNYLARTVISTVLFFLSYAPVAISQDHNHPKDIGKHQQTTTRAQFAKNGTKLTIGRIIGALAIVGLAGSMIMILVKSKQNNYQNNTEIKPIKTADITNGQNHQVNPNEQNNYQNNTEIEPITTTDITNVQNQQVNPNEQNNYQNNTEIEPITTTDITNRQNHQVNPSEQNSYQNNTEIEPITTADITNGQNHQVNPSEQNHYQNNTKIEPIKTANITNSQSQQVNQNDQNNYQKNTEIEPIKTDKITNSQSQPLNPDQSSLYQKKIKTKNLRNSAIDQSNQEPNSQTKNKALNSSKEKTATRTSSTPMRETNIWQEKEYLFSLPVVKQMNAKLKDTIITYIENNNSKGIYRLIANKLTGENKLKKLNKKLDKDGYYDLETLCADVIERKPEQDNSLLNYWIKEKKEKAYFKNKTLHINLHNVLTIHQLIKSFDFTSSKKDRIRMILIDDFDTSIMVEKTEKNEYQISIAQQKKESFFETLLMLSKDKKPQKISIIKKSNFSCSLSAGNYVLLSLKEASAGSGHSVKKLLESFYDTSDVIKSYHQPTKYDSLKVIEMRSSEEKKDVFRIGIFIYRSQDPIVGIIVRKNNEKVEYWDQKVAVSDILIAYQVKELETKIKPLSTELFKNSFQVINQVNNHAIDTQNRKKISSLEKEVLDIFLSKESCRQHLIDTFIQKGAISLEDIQKYYKESIVVLNQKIEDIVHLYRDKLSQKEVTPKSILSRLVERTLMSSITSKFSSVNETLLELLNSAHQHTKNLKGKSIVLVLGNEGVGKSTTVSYLIGDELIQVSNEVGEKTIKQKKAKKESPTIGNKIGRAETLYVRGFEVKKRDRSKFPSLIVDSPGLENVQSNEHILCANMSLDQAILQSGPIKGIVLVIPLQAFLVHRGTPAFKLIKLVKQKFPDVFQVNSKELKYAHILITKDSQHDQDIVSAFKKGLRFTRILNDLNEQQNKITEKKTKNIQEQQSAISAIEEEKEIWRLMQILHEEKRFYLVDLDNKRHRERLLAQYGNVNGSISKANYQTALEPYQIDQLNTLVKESFVTWQEIFEEYGKLNHQFQGLNQQEQSIKTEVETIKSSLENPDLSQNQLNKSQEANSQQKIKEAEKELAKTQSTLNEIKQKKKRYAFIIMKKQGEPSFLIELASTLFDNPKWKKKKKVAESMIDLTKDVYQKFLKYHDEHATHLYNESEKDLEGTEILKKMKAIDRSSQPVDDDESDSSESDKDQSDSSSESDESTQ